MSGCMAGAAVFVAGGIVTMGVWFRTLTGSWRRPVIAGLAGGAGGGLITLGIVLVVLDHLGPDSSMRCLLPWTTVPIAGLLLGITHWFMARFALEGRRDR